MGVTEVAPTPAPVAVWANPAVKDFVGGEPRAAMLGLEMCDRREDKELRVIDLRQVEAIEKAWINGRSRGLKD